MVDGEQKVLIAVHLHSLMLVLKKKTAKSTFKLILNTYVLGLSVFFFSWLHSSVARASG